MHPTLQVMPCSAAPSRRSGGGSRRPALRSPRAATPVPPARSTAMPAGGAASRIAPPLPHGDDPRPASVEPARGREPWQGVRPLGVAPYRWLVTPARDSGALERRPWRCGPKERAAAGQSAPQGHGAYGQADDAIPATREQAVNDRLTVWGRFAAEASAR